MSPTLHSPSQTGLGAYVVRTMSGMLNIFGLLLILAGGALGAFGGYVTHRGQMEINDILLMIGMGSIGLGMGYFIVVILLGWAFLALEINHNLTKILDQLKK